MRLLLFFSLFALLFSSEETALSINGTDYSEAYIIAQYSQQEWDAADSSRKHDMLAEFIKHNTGTLAALELNLQNYPKTRIKLRNQKYHFLVNEAYEEFVARNAISDTLLDFTRKYLSKEILVSHILIGYSGCNLRKAIDRSKEDARQLALQVLDKYRADTPFETLAAKYSDDPSVTKNSGKLGWLGVGKTIQEFQNAAFLTAVGEISQPVLTEYGYHLILVNEERPSQFSQLDSTAYAKEVDNAAMGAVYGELKGLAEAYDKNVLIEKNVQFNEEALQVLMDAINDKINKNKIVGSSKLNLVTTLSDIQEAGVVVTYGGKGYGVKWFAERLSRVPSSRHPKIGSVADIKSAFETIILQDAAFQKAVANNLSKNATFSDHFNDFRDSVLFDAYVKYLMNNIPEPSSDAISEYYENNKREKFHEAEKVSVREIKVRDEDTLHMIYDKLNSGEDFETLAGKYSLTNPDSGGKVDPFTEGRYGVMGQAAFQLTPGQFSEPLKNLDNSWSIVLLVEKIPAHDTPLKKVKNRIVSILKRELQNKTKEDSFAKLNEQYNVQVNPDFFNYEN